MGLITKTGEGGQVSFSLIKLLHSLTLVEVSSIELNSSCLKVAQTSESLALFLYAFSSSLSELKLSGAIPKFSSRTGENNALGCI